MRAKYIRFCHEYIIDNNATKAAERTGYKASGAAVAGCRLMKRPQVLMYIAQLKAEQIKRTEITADKVLEQYRRLAFADIQDYFHIVYKINDYYRTNDKTYRQDERIKHRLRRAYGWSISDEKYNHIPDKYKPYYKADEVLKPFKLLTVEQRAAIAGITYDKAGNPILKLSNKETSLDALAKHLGIYEKDNKQKGDMIVNKITRTIVDPT